MSTYGYCPRESQVGILTTVQEQKEQKQTITKCK